MPILAQFAVLVVALLHLGFMLLETWLWTRPAGLRIFRNTPEKAEATRVLAANQGLYNGFLAAGLLWFGATAQWPVVQFFLGCVVLAGAYGAYSVSRRILWVQALPAAVAMALVALAT